VTGYSRLVSATPPVQGVLLRACWHFARMRSTQFGSSDIMASITVRSVPDEVHRALRVLAARHGRSAEAEIRDILERAVEPAKRVLLGDALAALGCKVGLMDEDIAAVEQMRDKASAPPMKFE
jgi:plasmid stability protein